MRYYELTSVGEFKPVSRLKYMVKAEQSKRAFGVGYVMFMILDGGDACVLLPTENIRLVHGSHMGVYPLITK